MSAYTAICRLTRGQDFDTIHLACPGEPVAARICLITKQVNGVSLSIGWAIGEDQWAMGRTLHTTVEPAPWARSTMQDGVCVTAPGLTFKVDEWREDGLTIVPTMKLRGDDEVILATLFTAGNFAFGDSEDNQIQGYEYLGLTGDDLIIEHDDLYVRSRLRDTLPIQAGWALGRGKEGAENAISVFTDWTISANPVHIGPGDENRSFSSHNPIAARPDLVTLIGSASNLTLDQLAESQDGGSLSLSTITRADDSANTLGFAVLNDYDRPVSRGWFSEGQITHRTTISQQTFSAKLGGWNNDEVLMSANSRLLANWQAAFWYAPQSVRLTSGRETVGGALR